LPSIQSHIVSQVRRLKKESILFPSDFAKLGSDEAIRQALSRLVKDKKLIRLAKGIYFWPQNINQTKSFPAVQNIAKAIARRDKTRIIPKGTHALNCLGLSNKKISTVEYMTDGVPRTIKVGPTTISLQRKTARTLAIKNETLAIIVGALQKLGKDNIPESTKAKLKLVLLKENPTQILKELMLAPSWIAKLLKTIVTEDFKGE
jgi:hypothetical protein